MRRPPRIEPGPGQESVWDYPRPPRIEPAAARLRVEFAGAVIADSVNGWRVLETSQPPAFYIPAADVDLDRLTPGAGRSHCEWKGEARYWSVVVGRHRSENAAWSYPEPTPRFVAISDHLAFYPQRVDACFVGDEQVQPNDGSFYGGWITSKVVGPFKGGPGTLGW